MARECAICGKRTVAGRSIATRGRAKYLGGVGIKTTGVSKRKFRPNLHVCASSSTAPRSG